MVADTPLEPAGGLARTDTPGRSMSFDDCSAGLDLIENACWRFLVRFDLCAGLSDHFTDVCIAPGGHRSAVSASEPSGLPIRTSREQPRIVDFDGVSLGQFLAGDVFDDTVADLLKGMGNDRKSASLANAVEGFVIRQRRRDSFGDTECEDVAVRRGDFDSWNSDEIVQRCLLDGVETGGNLVVVCNGDRVQPDSLGLFEDEIDGVPTVVRKLGMTVQFNREHASNTGWRGQKRFDRIVGLLIELSASEPYSDTPFQLRETDTILCGATQSPAMTGLYYEDFTVGETIEHSRRRTVSEADNQQFCDMTMNQQPLHLDSEFAAETQFGERIVNGLYTMSLGVALTIPETTDGTIVANLGYDNVEHPEPVYHGDTLGAESRVTSKRETSDGERGVVEMHVEVFNQHDDVVCTFDRKVLSLKAP